MLQFQVEGMSCNHCVQAVTRAITARDAQARVSVDLGAGQVNVESRLPAPELAAAITDAGYAVTKTPS
ncbi:heavy metal transporter [Pandoraea terrae]|uniref:Heavy metal transporter n=1 Tax=Pandoraea terrae TaxID=1537710 RepID=A0A5E4XEW6_9BURK|nr:heavy-metal-associated domain-containing protein [Pandoraea terrae]VVE34710.1 heavy metal transporter [Pandoraea terrae]